MHLKSRVLMIVCLFCFFTGQAWSQTSFAVVPMDVRGELKPEIVESIMSNLHQVLVNSKKFRIVDRAAVNNILSEQALQKSGLTEKENTVKLGKLLNVEKLIVAAIYDKGGHRPAVNLRVIDVATGETELYKEIYRKNYSPADHGRFCAVEIIAHYPLLGSIEGLVQDIAVVDIGAKQGLKAGDRLFVARKEILRGSDGAILFQEYKRVGMLEIIAVSEQRSKAIIKEIQDSSQSFTKGDLVSPEPIPRQEARIFHKPLLEKAVKGKLILEDDMESVKYLSVNRGQGKAYDGGKLHLNAMRLKAGHAYSIYPQPFDQLSNIIIEGEIEFNHSMSKTNIASIAFRSNSPYPQSNCYRMSIDDKGNYEVYLMQNGVIVKRFFPLPSSPYLKRGASTNSFRIVAYESRFDFYLNEQYVGSFEDELLPRGAIGIFAFRGSYVAFDNIKVWEALLK